MTLYELSQQGQMVHLQQLPQFLVNLHQQGVYFRDLHTKNVLYQPNQQFALLDITSVKIQRRPLSPYQRARNIFHLLRKEDCRNAILPLGISELVNNYLRLAALPTDEMQRFWHHLQRRLKKYLPLKGIFSIAQTA